MNKQDRVYVAGHGGLVGGAIVRALQTAGFDRLLLRTRSELDLRDAAAVSRFFQDELPDYVFLAAAKVGGIIANSTFPADFIRDNLQIQTNVIQAAHAAGVKKLLFLGSSCIYPKNASQPLQESCLLTGPLEPTNEWYAIAKIAGIKMVDAYRQQHDFNGISVMPTNLYGPGDNFDLTSSHVLPALIRKFHEAKINGEASVIVWGSGLPRREFLHVDDLADACLFLMNQYDDNRLINVGWGEDISIKELALLIKDVTGYAGELLFDPSKPDGMARKLLDTSRMQQLGWSPRIRLYDGVASTYEWFLQNQSILRR